jgi:hypothetical protein
MRRFVTTIPMAILAVLLTVAMWMPSATKAANELRRLAADPLYFGLGEEKFTDLQPPGDLIYSKTVFVPGGANVLYLTMSTTGDTHGGAAGCFTALVDGAFFNPGGQGASKCATDSATGRGVNVPGWVALLKEPNGGTNCDDGGGGGGDCHDNSITYQWCTPIQSGPHTVEVRMATSHEDPTGGHRAFIEQAFFYVDASRVQRSGCGGPSDHDDHDDDDRSEGLPR